MTETKHFIFMDESGDTGFQSNSSPYFVNACAVFDNEYEVDKAIEAMVSGIYRNKKRNRPLAFSARTPSGAN